MNCVGNNTACINKNFTRFPFVPRKFKRCSCDFNSAEFFPIVESCLDPLHVDTSFHNIFQFSTEKMTKLVLESFGSNLFSFIAIHFIEFLLEAKNLI